MQTLLLSFNGLLLLFVLVALVKGSRVAYLTGLNQGFATGRLKGFKAGLQTGMASMDTQPVIPQATTQTGFMQPAGGTAN